jgi:hypothetical protein
MTDLSPIVHIVVGNDPETGNPTVFGTFFCDLAAQRLKRDLEDSYPYVSVEPWLIGGDGTPTEGLVKKNVYDPGDSVYFDDLLTRGIGTVIWNNRNKRNQDAPDEILYKVQEGGDTHYMSGSDIKGLVSSENSKNSLPL